MSNDRVVSRGGGVGLYVKNDITFLVYDDLTIMKEKNFESIFVNVKIDGKMITCGTVHRSPASEDNSHRLFVNDVNFCVSKLSLRNNCIVSGDFNYNLLASSDKHANNFIDPMYEYGFYSLISKPTRITDSSATVLDQIWTNILPESSNAYILVDPLADHLPVMVCFSLGDKSHKN